MTVHSETLSPRPATTPAADRPRPVPPEAHAILDQMLADLRQALRERAARQQAAAIEYASWLRPRP